MLRLSSSITDIKSHYEIVVVGSGYGGGIAASRLARAGREVCVLERGREYQPGEFPDSLASAGTQFQVDAPAGHLGDETGLFDLRINEDINVFMGCGVGGTSLVNANVSLRADKRVFDDEVWPAAVREDLDDELEAGYKHAEEMLRPNPYPEDFPELLKMRAHEKSAKELSLPFRRAPINVTFQDGINHVGVDQPKCTLCGDCVSGCNYGSKNTVAMNYLPDAQNHGARIFSHVSVRTIRRVDDRWVLEYRLHDHGREVFGASDGLFLTADIVVLSAGTLGTTEILLRSREAGLSLSNQLGESFSGNGDVLAFSYNNDETIRGVGYGNKEPDPDAPVGPCITSVIDTREGAALDEGMIIEEGSIPGAPGGFLPGVFASMSAVFGKDTDSGIIDKLKEKIRVISSLLRGPHHGAMNNTQTYLVMAHDGSDGKMLLEDDRLRISWPGVGERDIFGKINETLQNATRALGGTFVKNPTWNRFFNKNLVTVHPIGGCAMAEDAAGGVVNSNGQVFDSSSGNSVHESLYVADGSVIPRSLGVNPLLTICAVAERTCAVMARERGWNIDYALPSKRLAGDSPETPGVQFTETMKGFWSDGEAQEIEEYVAASKSGEAANSPLEFTLTIVSQDVDKFVTDAEHLAGMFGTVNAPGLSAHPLVATEGQFNLFIQDPANPDTKRMEYRMKLTSREGREFWFEGFKLIRDDRGNDMWDDTTTLFIKVHDGDSSESPVLGSGVLRIETKDFAAQMTTMKVLRGGGMKDSVVAMAKFGGFFAGSLWDAFRPK